MRHIDTLEAIEQTHGADLRTLTIRLHDEEGMTMPEIAQTLGIAPNTFRRWRRRYGIDVKPHQTETRRGADWVGSLEWKVRELGFSNLKQFVYNRADEGKTRAEMAQELGYAVHSLNDAMRRYGHEMPPRVRTKKQLDACTKTIRWVNETGRGYRRNHDYIFGPSQAKRKAK